MWMDSSCYCLICYSSKVAEMILNFSGLMHVFLNILRPEGERSVGHCMSLCPPTQGQTALRLKHNIVYERIDFLLIFLYQTGFKQIFTFFSPSPLMYLHSYQAWRICLLASQAWDRDFSWVTSFWTVGTKMSNAAAGQRPGREEGIKHVHIDPFQNATIKYVFHHDYVCQIYTRYRILTLVLSRRRTGADWCSPCEQWLSGVNCSKMQSK